MEIELGGLGAHHVLDHEDPRSSFGPTQKYVFAAPAQPNSPAEPGSPDPAGSISTREPETKAVR
jgi:hypothetical protein